MTVQQLVSELQKFDPNREVLAAARVETYYGNDLADRRCGVVDVTHEQQRPLDPILVIHEN